jgi:predicted metalloprotease
LISSILGQTEKDVATQETAKNTLRTDLMKKIAAGGGFSLGASIVFGAFELLHSDPHEAFPLLIAWGPWAIVALVALYFGYDLLKAFLNIGTRAVAALEELAVAQKKSADKDDLQLQEIQTLTAYTSQQSERTWQKQIDHFELTLELTKKIDALMSQGKESK